MKNKNEWEYVKIVPISRGGFKKIIKDSKGKILKVEIHGGIGANIKFFK